MKASQSSAPVPESANTELLRRMARANIAQAAVTDGYRADRKAVLAFLNEALATQIVCGLRYRRHHFMARGLATARIAEEFLLHSDEEMAHADLIAARIVQLGGEPDFSPGTLTQRSHAQYVPASSIADMVEENLAAERLTIDRYRGFIEAIGEDDPTTRRMLEGILGVEEAHADELADLLAEDLRGK